MADSQIDKDLTWKTPYSVPLTQRMMGEKRIGRIFKFFWCVNVHSEVNSIVVIILRQDSTALKANMYSTCCMLNEGGFFSLDFIPQINTLK